MQSPRIVWVHLYFLDLSAPQVFLCLDFFSQKKISRVFTTVQYFISGSARFPRVSVLKMGIKSPGAELGV